jgi:hypothetical protein
MESRVSRGRDRWNHHDTIFYLGLLALSCTVSSYVEDGASPGLSQQIFTSSSIKDQVNTHEMEASVDLDKPSLLHTPQTGPQTNQVEAEAEATGLSNMWHLKYICLFAVFSALRLRWRSAVRHLECGSLIVAANLTTRIISLLSRGRMLSPDVCSTACALGAFLVLATVLIAMDKFGLLKKNGKIRRYWSVAYNLRHSTPPTYLGHVHEQ